MKQKETIRSLWTPTAWMLTGARRAAMLLLTTLLLTMAAQTAWAQDDENRQITVTVTWVDDNNLDGKRPTSVEVYLLANEEPIGAITVSSEGNWTAIYDLPESVDAEAGIEIKINEDLIEGLYDCSIESTDITFTRKTGGLTVINTVTNSLEYLNDKEFTFTVTLEPKISGTFGDMNFNNGIATFTLKNGEPFTASGLPTSLGYTVTVDPEEGFTSEESTITGTVATDGSSTAAFAHTYSAVGSVTLEAKANVENPYLQTKSFAFNLLNANNYVIQNVEQNNETGKATFYPINYTLDDLDGNQSKDFVYTIEQVIPEGAETINGWPANDGVAYDNRSNQVTVTVTDNKDGKLHILFDGNTDLTIPVWDNKVVATVTADDLSKDYGEDDPELTAKVKVGEEEIIEEVSYMLSRVEGENVGEYVITPVGELNQGYYTIIYNSGTLTINRKVVTITAGSDSRTYDGTALNKNTFTATPLESGDTHTFTVEMTSESTITDVGTQPNVIATVDGVAVETGEETIVGNYLVTTVNGTLTINPITENVTVTITEHSNSDKIVYDGKEHTVTGYDVAIDNELYTEDDFTFSGNAEVKGTDAGTYPMELMPEDFTNTNQNFSNVIFIITDGTLTIDKAPLTVTANDHRILYGNAAENSGVNYVGFVNGETENVLSGELKYTYTNDSGPYGAGNDGPGEYDITPYGDDVTATNYAITFVPGKLTVEAITVKVKVVNIDNGEELTGAHVQVLNTEENFVEEWDSGTGIHEVGGLKAGKTYTIHESVAPDGYLLPADKTFTIATNGTVTYSGTTTDESGNTVLLVQNSMTHVEISVVDKLNGEKLAEGHVQVIDSERLVDEWDSKSDENHIIEGLETGVEYTIRETVAPNNYLLSLDYTFTIDANGTIATNGPTTVESGKTVLLVQNDMCINLSVAINWNDFENKYSVRPTTVTVTLSDGTNETSYPLNNDSNPLTCTVEKLQKYKNGTEIVYSWTITGELDCYEQSKEVNGTTTTFTMPLRTNGNCGQPGSEAAVRWDYDIDSKTITISGTGYMMYYNSIQNADESWSNGAPWKAFADEIEAVVIEDGITYVGSNTFAHCPHIKSITLPADGIYEIGPGAFADCTSLTSIDIPMSINKIGNQAFAGCSSLATVTIGYGEASSFTIGTDVFPATAVIIVPEASLSGYQTATGWSTYQIVPATRTLFAAESTKLWMTWCDKYAYVKPEGAAVYTVSSVATDKVTLAEVSGDVIPAYTPVLLYRAAAGEDAVTATFSAVGTAPASGYDAANGICSQSNQAGTFTFFGATTAMAKIPDNDFTYYNGGLTYVLYGDKFLKTDSNSGIAANRCWLKLPTQGGTGGVNARRLVIVVDDDATAIADRQLSTVNSQLNEWYTLDGRKLSGKPTKKGLYIYNGKKTVVK